MGAVALALLSLAPAPALANCAPPWRMVFACDILNDPHRVELCQEVRPDGSAGGMSYNYAAGTALSELYFETDAAWFSTKYYGDRPDHANTLGLGLKHGRHVYAVYVTGIHQAEASSAQLHVFDNMSAFDSDVTETEALRLYCDPATVRVDADILAP